MLPLQTKCSCDKYVVFIQCLVNNTICYIYIYSSFLVHKLIWYGSIISIAQFRVKLSRPTNFWHVKEILKAYISILTSVIWKAWHEKVLARNKYSKVKLSAIYLVSRLQTTLWMFYSPYTTSLGSALACVENFSLGTYLTIMEILAYP